jgi:2-polyprenyl-3-methyl-5-hydroxy-6-metoxy-1,4-benzoquinol methylase
MSLYSEKESDYFSSARIEIIDLLPKYSDRVLEVGCGSGKTLEILKEKKYCNETVGIELFATAAEQARNRVDTVYCMDVENCVMPEGIGKFNLILLLDVLEHLVDPWVFLSRLVKGHLANNGKVIVSLPNARHFSLLGPLLIGKFDYAERGILDKTHLRFFTKSSAENLLKNAGLHVETIKPTSLNLSLNSGKLNALTLGIFSEFLASQYIFLTSLDK